MSTKKYLDLDINKLFENYTIKDIELLQKQIQHESDRKKVELRTLVGERYRDLIQAADSIAEMKQTSESVMTKIINIEETFHELQQKYLIGFKMETEAKPVHKEPNSISDSVIVQIKILMDIPEQIWSAIDEKNLLQATQLFLLAQHINYSLKFEVGDSDLANRYPIVPKQWSIINQFKTLIFNFCNETLQSIELSTELAANCLAALVLLDGLNSSNLLSKLITLRSQTIQSIVGLESDLSVKNKIKLYFKVLMETIPLISNCFIEYKDNQECLVSMYINDIKDKDAFLMLSQLDLDEELINNFLPSVAKSHKPFVQYELKKLPSLYIQQSMDTWFEWVEKLSTVEVAKLLNLVTSVKGICKIRDECLAIDIPEKWDLAWRALCLPYIDLWRRFFQPFLTDRIKGISKDTLNICLSNLKQDITQLLGKLVTEKSSSSSEQDLRWFVWKDSPTDIPQKFIEGVSLDDKRPLFMKARGFSPNIVNLCQNFEIGLAELLSHLKQYELEKVPAMKHVSVTAATDLPSNRFCDRHEIQEYLQVIIGILINDLVTFIKQECVIENPKYGRQDINCIVTARFLQAIPLLCTNFKECFKILSPLRLSYVDLQWNKLCDTFEHESTTIWSFWAQCFSKTISHHRNAYLIQETIDHLRIHTIISEWEKVMIEEQAEEGKRINSEILVPYQTTVHLQIFLSKICQDLNKVIAHTIPKTALYEIINSIVLELFDYYNNLSTILEVRQKQAIQILFDVKYITLMMVPRYNNLLVEKSTKICNSLISKIDPFDFNVFSPFINTNVKKAVQRSILIFGNLVPDMSGLCSILGARIEQGDGLKSMKDPPGVLALCTSTPWFPLLAVTAPAKTLPVVTLPIPEKIQIKKPSGKDHTRNDSTGSTIKSGAAAFFGAMGSDWFGSS